MRYNPAPDLTYELIRSKRRTKTLSLQVKKDGTVTMLVPQRVSKREADNFFRQKEEWIRKQLTKMSERADSPNTERKFVAGEKFLYHGEEYPLEMGAQGSKAGLVLSHGTFILTPGSSDGTRAIFVDWYRNTALRELAERMRHYSSRTGLIPKRITITDARTRYGSCSAANRLSFSWRIIMAPYSVMDYVILHELAHIKVKNHSPRFWDFLETICPGWKEERRWLREHGHRLTF